MLLREGDRKKLGDLARLPSVPSGLTKRARMILLAADGVPNAEIARRVGVSRPTVIGWRERYEAGGIPALQDVARPVGRRRSTRSRSSPQSRGPILVLSWHPRRTSTYRCPGRRPGSA